ncbi:uncharacterized protein LOC142466889 [Ascaphus truei]|uniref:uncharacterized protein LOC142466889 n=1 Tax=Ascaphus truei TaxID=8439 RepID=UPI003F592B52
MSHKSTSGLKTRSESSCSLELRTVWQANSDRDNNIQESKDSFQTTSTLVCDSHNNIGVEDQCLIRPSVVCSCVPHESRHKQAEVFRDCSSHACSHRPSLQANRSNYTSDRFNCNQDACCAASKENVTYQRKAEKLRLTDCNSSHVDPCMCVRAHSLDTNTLHASKAPPLVDRQYFSTKTVKTESIGRPGDRNITIVLKEPPRKNYCRENQCTILNNQSVGYVCRDFDGCRLHPKFNRVGKSVDFWESSVNIVGPENASNSLSLKECECCRGCRKSCFRGTTYTKQCNCAKEKSGGVLFEAEVARCSTQPYVCKHNRMDAGIVLCQEHQHNEINSFSESFGGEENTSLQALTCKEAQRAAQRNVSGHGVFCSCGRLPQSGIFPNGPVAETSRFEIRKRDLGQHTCKHTFSRHCCHNTQDTKMVHESAQEVILPVRFSSVQEVNRMMNESNRFNEARMYFETNGISHQAKRDEMDWVKMGTDNTRANSVSHTDCHFSNVVTVNECGHCSG